VSKIMEARHNFSGEWKLIQVSQFTSTVGIWIPDKSGIWMVYFS
jgi:hypothetical protein